MAQVDSRSDLATIERRLNEIPIAIESRQQLEQIIAILSDPSVAPRDPGNKSTLRMVAFTRLQQVKSLQLHATAKNVEAHSRDELARYIAQIKALPDTDESLAYLQGLSWPYESFRGLSNPDRSTLYQRIAERITELQATTVDRRCAKALTPISIPAELKDALLVHPSERLKLTRFLCAAYAANGDVSVSKASGSDDAYIIQVKEASMKFSIGRFAADGRTFVSPSSPIAGNQIALRLESYSTSTIPERSIDNLAIAALYADWQQPLGLLMQKMATKQP